MWVMSRDDFMQEEEEKEAYMLRILLGQGLRAGRCEDGPSRTKPGEIEAYQTAMCGASISDTQPSSEPHHSTEMCLGDHSGCYGPLCRHLALTFALKYK